MDIDAFVARHEKTWKRLEYLLSKRRLNGEQVDELIALYQICSSHLSYMQSVYAGENLTLGLSELLVKANNRITSGSKFKIDDILKFFTHSFPASLYSCRWWTFGSALAFFLIAIVQCIWIVNSKQAQDAIGTPAQLQIYAKQAFSAYYTNFSAPEFTTMVWTNNAYIAAVMVATGITGIMPLYMLFQNAVALGQAGAIMYLYGDLKIFFTLIIPHGLLELTAIFIACGAGLKMFYALVEPTQLSRRTLIAKQGRSLAITAIGLCFVLLISGFIEGFITGSNLVPEIKIIIGTLALILLLIYTLIVGKQAFYKGNEADIEQRESGYLDLEQG